MGVTVNAVPVVDAATARGAVPVLLIVNVAVPDALHATTAEVDRGGREHRRRDARVAAAALGETSTSGAPA